MAEKKMRQYQWFCEPRDRNTNDVLASELSEEDFLREVPVGEGVKRHVWRLNAQLLRSLQNSRPHAGLKFKLYVQEGNGRLRSAHFLKDARRKKILADVAPLSHAA